MGLAHPRSVDASSILRLGLRARLRAAREAGDARSALLDLAERLRAPRRVDPDGVRLTRELLVDGSGPLYEPGDLRAAAVRALRALDGHGADG